jgi:hypothetical protein
MLNAGRFAINVGPIQTATKYPKQIKADGTGELIINRSDVRGSITIKIFIIKKNLSFR